MTERPDGQRRSATSEEAGLRWLSYCLLGIAGLAAVLVHITKGVPLGWAFFALFVGWPALGMLVTADDDMPGGWSNPDGTLTPPWEEAPFWGRLVLGCAISAAGFAIDSGWASLAGLRWWCAGLGAASVGVSLVTGRRVLLAGGAMLFIGLWSGLP